MAPFKGGGPDPAAKSYLADLIYEAAVVLLHREIRKHGEVRRSNEDFEFAQQANDDYQAIQLAYDFVNGDVIFTHARADVGRPVD